MTQFPERAILFKWTSIFQFEIDKLKFKLQVLTQVCDKVILTTPIILSG